MEAAGRTGCEQEHDNRTQNQTVIFIKKKFDDFS